MGGSLGNSAWPMENLGRALPLPPAPGRFAPAARVCPPAQCAWRLGPSARPEAGSSRAPAAAASSSVREQRRGGTRRRGSSPAPPAQPGSARPDSLPTPGQPPPPSPGEKVEEEIQPLARAHHHGPL